MPTLTNPFSDQGVQEASISAGYDPNTMGRAADTAIQNNSEIGELSFGGGGFRPLVAPAAEEAAPAAGAATAAEGASSGLGGYLSAGTQAAATTAQLVSQAVQAQAQREFGAAQNDLDRQLQAKLAQMQISESRYESNNSNRVNAYKMLLSALQNNINATLGSSQNIRNSAQGFDSLLSQAFLK